MRTVMLLASLLLACSHRTASAGPKSDAAIAPPVAPAAPADAVPPAAPADDARIADKGTTATMSDDAAIKAHYQKIGWGDPAEIKPFGHVPSLYEVSFADGMGYALVFGGKVVETTGVDALGAYVRDAKLAATPGLDGKDGVTLLVVFAAFPATSGYADPQAYYDDPRFPELRPKLTTDAAGIHVVLNYWVPATKGPAAARVMQWTLDATKDGKATWHEAKSAFDPAKH